MQFVVKFITRQRAGGHRDDGGEGGGWSPNCPFPSPQSPSSPISQSGHVLTTHIGESVRENLRLHEFLGDEVPYHEGRSCQPTQTAQFTQPTPYFSRSLCTVLHPEHFHASHGSLALVVRGPIPAVCQFMKRFSLSTFFLPFPLSRFARSALPFRSPLTSPSLARGIANETEIVRR